jgi:hypothetical protein
MKLRMLAGAALAVSALLAMALPASAATARRPVYRCEVYGLYHQTFFLPPSESLQPATVEDFRCTADGVFPYRIVGPAVITLRVAGGRVNQVVPFAEFPIFPDGPTRWHRTPFTYTARIPAGGNVGLEAMVVAAGYKPFRSMPAISVTVRGIGGR